MESVIIKPKKEILKKYIQYFLFFKKSNNASLNYTTFPNSNLCLAIYKENHVDYNTRSNQNNCVITEGNKTFISKLYGFHKMPFNVTINSNLDQICIIFNPSGLRAFTHESYDNLMGPNNIFDIFTIKDGYVLEQLFEEKVFSKRAERLERLLLENLKYNISHKLREALYIIHNSNTITVEGLAQKMETSTSTLFRLFKNKLGQNPKSYLKTIRFRNTLNGILCKQNTLTDIAYQNQFYDQAHFIHDFKIFSGCSPKQLISNISVQHNDLVWIYNEIKT